MEKYLSLIADTTLMQSFPPEKIHAYLKNGGFRTAAYKKNSVIHFEGESCHKLEIILSGQVAVERIDESGNLLTVAEFYSDDILGGNLMFSKNPYYPMTTTTRTSVLILEIDKDLLFELLSKHPAFLQSYLSFVSDHTAILGDKIKHYVNKTIRESILNYLRYESKRQNSNHIRLTLTKKALAERIGVQRTSLSRELAKMKKDGILLFDSESVTLLSDAL